MKWTLLIAFFSSLSITLSVQAQNWTWTELPSMPEPVANNAVVEAYSGDTLCVYSFTGIDSTKEPSGIHLKAWRYNTLSEQWMSLPDVPDFQGKIAAGASVVDNKIYLIGGYYVNDDFSEISSDDIHIFDPETNSWEEDGAPIPIPIDDQVQAVWRDSLIYVVTGWSNTTNVSAVQIYDPALDTWSVGTSTPSSSTYRAFGASGIFVGDTLFYYGGVSSSSFAANNRFRKGAIDPDDPNTIEWDLLTNPPGEDGYRMAAVRLGNEAIWIGGAGTSYNFDGIAYDNSGGVPPHYRIMRYNAVSQMWIEDLNEPYGVMDLRGAAQVSSNQWIICGGMLEDQEVSDKAFLVSYVGPLSVFNETAESFSVYRSDAGIVVSNLPQYQVFIELFAVDGKRIGSFESSNSSQTTIPIDSAVNSVIVALYTSDGNFMGGKRLLME